VPETNYRFVGRLGILNLEEKKPDQASQSLNCCAKACHEVLGKAPEFYEAMYFLGLVQLGRGEVEEARGLYETALRMCGAGGAVSIALQDLEMLRRAAPQLAGLDDMCRRLKQAIGEAPTE